MGLFDWIYESESTEPISQKKVKDVDFSNFKMVTDFLYEKTGIIELDKKAFISLHLQKYAVTQGIYSSYDFLQAMKNKEDFLQEILNIATVNETFFMREINELKWLVDYIQKSDKQLKILSMPSSSGEEVYSILLLMLQKNLDLNRVEIKGYDIDSDAIKKAKEGVFDEHSVHKLDTEVKNRYFTPYGEEHYKIAQNIKNHTFFQQKNIFDLPNEHFKYDVVLSRNMFIYFDDEKRNKALEIIVDLLNPDGIYIKGHADYIKENDQLENIAYGIYKKTSF